MDRTATRARIVGTRWRARAMTSAPGCAAPGLGRLPTSRRSFAPTGRAPIAPRTSWCTTRLRPRISPRRVSSPPYALSTASTLPDLSAPGCTASWSTGRSTGPERGPCGARWARARPSKESQPRSGEIPPPRSRTTSSQRSPRSRPTTAPSSSSATSSSTRPGEIARMLELPRGTVNSRLRRGLDALQDVVGRPEER